MTEEKLGDEPIEPEFVAMMNGLARALQEMFNGEGVEVKDSKVGFILICFNMGDDPGRCNYISNARRSDVLALLKEQVKRFEGMYHEEPS